MTDGDSGKREPSDQRERDGRSTPRSTRSGNGKRRARVALRLLIGAILAVTAAGKLLDVSGFARVLDTYDAFPRGLLLPIAVVVPLAELVLAIWLFSGRRPFPAAVWALGMHLVYAGWSAASVLRGLKLANCGCFGVFWPRPLGWSTVAEDIAVAAACGALAVMSPRGRPA